MISLEILPRKIEIKVSDVEEKADLMVFSDWIKSMDDYFNGMTG